MADRDTSSPERSDDGARSSRTKAILATVGVVAVLLLWLFGAAVIPRWWAQRISDLIDGRLTFGTLLGIAVGFVFTAVPLIVLWVGWHFRSGLKRAAAFTALAAVVAFPNLATLGIVLGDGGAAHAGERILDVDGPGFRGGSVVGAIASLAVFVLFLLLARSRRRNKAKARRLSEELKSATS